MKKTFGGETENLYVNGTDMNAVTAAVTAQLRAGPDHRRSRHLRRAVRARRGASR